MEAVGGHGTVICYVLPELFMPASLFTYSEP